MKLKIKLKEILLKLDTMLIVFLGVFYVIYVMIAPTDTIPLNVLEHNKMRFGILRGGSYVNLIHIDIF